MNQGRSLARLPLETPAEHTLFVSALDTVCTALEVSDTNKARLHSEHDTYRVHFMTLPMSKLKNDGALLQTVRDLRVVLQPLAFIRDVCHFK
jgi:hypothetical protein